MIKAIIFDFYGVIYQNDRLDEDLIDLVDRLKSKYKTAIVSNIGRASFNQVMPEKVQDLFDEILLSGETGYFKPEPESFLEATHRLGVKPEFCVMIDDTLTHVDASRLIGMYGILYENLDQLKMELGTIVNTT